MIEPSLPMVISLHRKMEQSINSAGPFHEIIVDDQIAAPKVAHQFYLSPDLAFGAERMVSAIVSEQKSRDHIQIQLQQKIHVFSRRLC